MGSTKRSLTLLAAVGSVLALTCAPSAFAASSLSCNTNNNTIISKTNGKKSIIRGSIVSETASAFVLRQNVKGQQGATYYSCWKSNHRATLLGATSKSINSQQRVLGGFVIAKNYVGLSQLLSIENKLPNSQKANLVDYDQFRSVDMRNGRTVRTSERIQRSTPHQTSGRINLSSLVIAPNGTLGWLTPEGIVGETNKTGTIRLSVHPLNKTIAFSNGTLYWTHNSTPQSALIN